jgi:excinuclease ABC subunit C
MSANAYGMMIVGGPEGFVKSPLRKFRGRIASSDDFAMMREGLQRRFGRALKEDAEAPAMTGEGHAVRRGRVHISPHPA